MINTNFCVPQYFNFSSTQPLHKMFISSELIHTINWEPSSVIHPQKIVGTEFWFLLLISK